jgi:predicted nucleic acid-binding protein
MIFVDTGAWFALVVPQDVNHSGAKDVYRAFAKDVVTTDFVFDELMTLLKARDEYDRALDIGSRIIEQDLCQLVRVDDLDLRAAWMVFERYTDKEWSFTDCTSLVVMERLGITQAFAFDHHFKQFPGVTVVPQTAG